jgi:broad specificity phosphatase PhoE
MLILVRHAMPDASPEAASASWPLSADGSRAAAALRSRLPGDARLVASTEPKAWQTLGGPDASGGASTAAEVERDPRFCEVDRPAEPWSDDFRTRRAEYVSGVAHPEWEPQAEVARRFGVGLAAYADGARPVVVATHGMAMTVWLVSAGLVDADAAAQFWSGLRFPDAHLIDVESQTVRRWPPADRASA